MRSVDWMKVVAEITARANDAVVIQYNGWEVVATSVDIDDAKERLMSRHYQAQYVKGNLRAFRSLTREEQGEVLWRYRDDIILWFTSELMKHLPADDGYDQLAE